MQNSNSFSLERLIAEARRLHLAGDVRRARATAEAVLRQAPRNLQALEVIALLEMEHGDLGEAIRLLKRIAKELPASAEAQYNLALAYRYSGRLELAATGFNLALKLKPELGRARAELADTYANLGRFEDLAQVCRAMIEAGPYNPRPYSHLAFNMPAALSEQDLALMTKAARDPKLQQGTKASFLFSLAEILRRKGMHDEAFAALKAANDLVRATLGNEAAPTRAIAPAGEKPRLTPPEVAATAHTQVCDYVRDTFTPEFLSKFGGHGERSRIPVFIVGMPRSGSTLVEQILASHPSVFGAGEIPDLSILTNMRWPYGGPSSDGGKRPKEPPAPLSTYFRDIGREYIARLRKIDAQASMVVNKMLGNYVHIGMIELCLPDAVVIDIRRDAVDTCLACYQRQFRTGHEFTYDLAAMGAQYRRYVAIMDHWDRVLPGRVLRLSYEELVRDPEPQIRRLLDHCGLPWSDEVLRFHENARPVRTASLSQVRRPISTASVAKWKPYARHLGPLLESLGDLAEANPMSLPRIDEAVKRSETLASSPRS
ncbi:tetratricopeptide repeat-containing sulfotransferase family protein [Mesorhizobium carmichaelinearum]|uniref:tetratricopeptide repeat-containing sulfotransferase family protein n=1 Tax=Mesorhizobium carmichaelinearum TaxID=1208188 RepID=UPI000BA4116A|nr:sulfotransferase [Mesorhizobium carmichaelinearum]